MHLLRASGSLIYRFRNMKRFIAIQVGARRNYAVPSILEKANMLEALYTDMCADAGIGLAIRQTLPQSLRPKAINRLLDRQLPEALTSKVHTFDLPACRYLVRQKLTGNEKAKQHRALMKFNHEFGKALIEKGTGKATHIYSMFGEGSQFLYFAKEQGLKVIFEAFLSPLTHKIVQTERENFPDIEAQLPDSIIQQDYAWFEDICKSVDLFITPSNFVNRGLEAFGISAEKYRTTPYAVSASWFQVRNQPVKGRILFVGTAELRKGIHVLGMAAEKLAPLGYEFRVAGGVSETVRNHKLTKHLNFLGRVPRSEIQQEYANADIFVLPSLSEGSAEVTYEALAAGLPVITTEATGSVVRDGIDGFIIPERDPDKLADCVKELVENRELRHQMSASAKAYASEYTWDKYSERLLKALNLI